MPRGKVPPYTPFRTPSYKPGTKGGTGEPQSFPESPHHHHQDQQWQGAKFPGGGGGQRHGRGRKALNQHFLGWLHPGEEKHRRKRKRERANSLRAPPWRTLQPSGLGGGPAGLGDPAHPHPEGRALTSVGATAGAERWASSELGAAAPGPGCHRAGRIAAAAALGQPLGPVLHAPGARRSRDADPPPPGSCHLDGTPRQGSRARGVLARALGVCPSVPPPSPAGCVI